jgi:hypothetical protein
MSDRCNLFKINQVPGKVKSPGKIVKFIREITCRYGGRLLVLCRLVRVNN